MIDLDSAPSEAEEDKDKMLTNHDETREPQPVKAMENPKKKPGRKPRQKPELEAASVKDGMEIAHSEAKMEEMAADPNEAQATSSLPSCWPRRTCPCPPAGPGQRWRAPRLRPS